MTRVDCTALSDSQLFKGMAAKEIEHLNGFFVSREVPEGKTVFIENMPGEALYLIRKGTVRISRMLAEGDEQILIVLGAGDVFGELAVFDGGERSATARIAEDALLYGLQRKDFARLTTENPRLGMQLTLNIVRIFSSRMRSAKKDYRAMLLSTLNRKPDAS